PAPHGVPDPLLDGRDELLWDDPADDLVLEDETRAALAGLEVDHHVAVLAVATGLADEARLDLLDALLDRLAVGDLGGAHVALDLELPLETVDDDLEVQLAHAGDDRLPGVLVRVGAERRILVGQLLQADPELVEVGLGAGLDGDRDDRIRERHALEHDRRLLVTQGVARAGVPQAHRSVDVPGDALLELLALVGVHAQDATDALPLAARGVQHAGPGRESPGVHAEEREV